jgi:ergothioneine biosynthesis protein EgtB
MQPAATGSSLERPSQTIRHETLLDAYRRCRLTTEGLAAPLTPEDQTIQSMPDTSPTKWHLAHTTWFFETFLLTPFLSGYRSFDPRFGFLFNSYYEAVGTRHPRPQRGLLSRPTSADVICYREAVDDAMAELLSPDRTPCEHLTPLIELGINHEQQHQELILTDILHAFNCNALRPAYRSLDAVRAPPRTASSAWIDFAGGLYVIGHAGKAFAFDNEGPRHTVFLQPFRLATRPVTNEEWQRFIDDDGYQRSELWLSDGWAIVQAEGWTCPLYWTISELGQALTMTLGGLRPIEPAAPVCHISFYEADAFARWSGKRVPTEAEWEVAGRDLPIDGNMLATGALQPMPDRGHSGEMRQMFGDVWEWTASPYAPYPGFRAVPGAIGEYNGKFMCNQMVLRGGSCVTPDGHLRPTYRNFFYPHQRWQFSGVRLAEDG